MMKYNIIRFLALLALLAVFAGCSKENGKDKAKDYEDKFKFYFNANIDGIPIEINAGAGGYVLNTGYTYDDSICIMYGALSQADDSLRNAVTIRFRGAKKIGHPSQFALHEMLGEGSFAYRDPSGMKVDPSRIDLRFQADTNSSSVYHTWSLPNGTFYSDSPEVRVNASAGTFDARLDSYIGSSCVTSVVHQVQTKDECDGTFEVEQNPDNTLDLEAYTHSGTITNTEWFINDSWVGRGAEHQQAPMADGIFYVKALLTFKNGCTKMVERQFRMSGGLLTDCMVDLKYERLPVRVDDPDQLRTVEIIYYDAYGKKYTSYYEGNSGEFAIHSLKNFRRNDSGQQTSRFIFEGSVVLKSEDGSIVTVTDGFGNFVVAHP